MLSNKSQLSNDSGLHSPIKLKPTLCNFQPSIWMNLPKSYQRKTQELISSIAAGKPYTCLGGVRIKCNRLLIRFRVGRNHRLIFLRRKIIMNSYSLIDKSMRKTFIELIDFKFTLLINNKEAKYSYLK